MTTFYECINYHKLTEQIPGTVFVATTKSTKEIEVYGVRYYFAKVTKKKFFGFKTVWIENFKINMAEIEKAIIDSLEHPELSGGVVEIMKAVWNGREAFSWKTLIDYGIKAGNKAVLQRLGFISEYLKIGIKKDIERLRKNISNSYTLLDTSLSNRGNYIHRWRLRVNVTEYEMRGWREY